MYKQRRERKKDREREGDERGERVRNREEKNHTKHF
jgi:hypothetical protein